MKLVADGVKFEIKNRGDVNKFIPSADTYDLIYPEFNEGETKYTVVINDSIVAYTHYKREAQLYAYYLNTRYCTYNYVVRRY